MAQATPMRNSSGPVHHGRRPPSGPRPSEAYTSNCRPTTEPVLPISLTRTETPATRTSTTTAIQPRPWIAAPMVRPTAPPNTAADPTRFSRARYGPPTSTTTVISPPMAASRPGARLPESSPAASGTQIASAARIISGQGTGTRFGRTNPPASRARPRRGPWLPAAEVPSARLPDVTYPDRRPAPPAFQGRGLGTDAVRVLCRDGSAWVDGEFLDEVILGQLASEWERC